MRTSAPCVNVLLHISHPQSARSNPHFPTSTLVRVTLSASRRSVREAMTSSTSGMMRVRRRELTARKRSLVYLRVGEQLSQEHLNGCVCPYMDIPHHLDMQDMCGSRSIRRGI